MASDYMVGTWLTAGSMCHILTQTGRGTKPAQSSRQPNPKWAARATGSAKICCNSLVQEIELWAPPCGAQFPFLPHDLQHHHVEKDLWVWFLHWHISSAPRALFVREKLNWPQLNFRIGSLKLRYLEASKSNQMLSIPIKVVLVILPTLPPNSWHVNVE